MSDLLSAPVAAFIGFGSNLQQPLQQINRARLELGKIPGIVETAFSPLYRSKPLGPADQPDYINAVMKIETRLSAHDLLAELQKIENSHGRIRSIRWGARTLDLDLLLYGQQIINDADLTVPHTEMANRAFVLYPLADISGPAMTIPGLGELSKLLAACPADGIERMCLC